MSPFSVPRSLFTILIPVMAVFIFSPVPAVPVGSVPEAVTAECGAIERLLAGLPGTEVSRSDGSFGDPVEGIRLTGCMIRAKGTFGALGGAAHPEKQIDEALQARGFKHDLRYYADGPDGAAFGMRNGEVMCLVRADWAGGDDSNPDYVPGDWFKLSASCATDTHGDGAELD